MYKDILKLLFENLIDYEIDIGTLMSLAEEIETLKLKE